MTLEGTRIVVDCAHGAPTNRPRACSANSGRSGGVRRSTRRHEHQPELWFDAPRTHLPQSGEHRACLGIAHDGDADRVLLCDETGALIDGDDIMAIAALDMLALGTLAKKTLVSTVMSNAGLDAVISAAGGRVVRTGVGDKHVIDEMLRNGFNFGGEQSGHLIFRDYSSTGDGLVSALQILRIMKAKKKPLSSLVKCWIRYPQLVANVRVREKKPFEELDGLAKLLTAAETELKARAAACCCAIPARNRRPACSWKGATEPLSRSGPRKSAT